MAGPLFLSHASQDAPRAAELCTALESRGLRCWIAPRDVRPGQEYAAEIAAAIANSRAFVLLLTGDANGSKWVAKEVERAVSGDKLVLVLRLADVQPGRGLDLLVSSRQWLDARSLPPQGQAQLVLEALARNPAQADAEPVAVPAPLGAGPVPAVASIPSARAAPWPKPLLIGGVVALAAAAAVTAWHWLANRVAPGGTPVATAASFLHALDQRRFNDIYAHLLSDSLRSQGTRESIVASLAQIRGAEAGDPISRRELLVLDLPVPGAARHALVREQATFGQSAVCEDVNVVSDGDRNRWLIEQFFIWAAPSSGCADGDAVTEAGKRADLFLSALHSDGLDGHWDEWIAPALLRNPGLVRSSIESLRNGSGNVSGRQNILQYPTGRFFGRIGNFVQIRFRSNAPFGPLLEEVWMEETAPGVWKIAMFGVPMQ